MSKSRHFRQLLLLLFICLLPQFTQAQSCTNDRYLGVYSSNNRYYGGVVFARDVPDFLLDLPLPQDLNIAATALFGSELGLINNIDLEMDIMMPPTTDTLTKRPVMIWAFPGGFISGSRDAQDMQALIDTFSARGYVTATIDYRIGADVGDVNSLERAVYRGAQDASAAIRFFQENADQFQIDPDNIFIGGSSAGAFGAVHAGYLDDSERAGLPSTYAQYNLLGIEIAADLGGVMSIPVTKVTSITASSINLASGTVPGNSHSGRPRGVISCWGAVGDLSWLDNGSDTPDMLIFHGEDDDIVHADCVAPFSTLFFGVGGVIINAPVTCGGAEMDDVLDANGIYYESYIEPGEWHEYWGTLNGDFDNDFLVNGIGGLGPDPNYWPEMINTIGMFAYTRMQPAQPIIAGNVQVCQGETATYTAPATDGSRWCWEVTGGTIVSNDIEANTIDVQWGAGTTGTLEVREINCLVVESEWSNVYNVTITNVNVPTSLTSASITNNSAVLSWANTTGATSYDVDYRPVGSTTWTTVSATNNTLPISALNACTSYEYQVSARCSATSGSNYSSIETFTTQIDPTTIPSGLGATPNASTNSANLSWASSGAGLTYEVQYQVAGTGNWQTLASTTTSTTISNLLGCTSYEYQVKAVCSASNSSTAYSSAASFTTDIAANAIPNGLNATPNASANSANLSWNSSGSGITYEVQYRIPPLGAWQTITSSTTSTNLTNLASCATYEYQVKAVCAASNSSTAYSSTASFTTDIDATAIPSGLSATPNTSTNSASLSWASSGAGLTYEVQYQVVGTGNWQTITSTANSATISNLAGCTNYEYQVKAVCTASNSSTAYSSTASFTTDITTSAIPSGLNATPDANTNSANLSWTSSGPGITYEIQYRMSPSVIWQTITSNTNSVNITGLSACTMYEYQVKAICTASNSATTFSTMASFVTDVDASSIPTSLAATPNTSMSSATVSWASGGGAGLTYEIEYQVAGSGNWQTATSATSSTSLTNLEPCSAYEYRVKAVCTVSNSSTAYTSMETFVMDIDPNQASTITAITDASAGSVNVNWNALNNVSYEIQYQTDGGSWQTLTSTTNNATVSGLGSCENYDFRVRGVCDLTGTITSFSAIKTHTTPIDMSSVPQNITTDYDATNAALTVSWVYAASNNIDYTIQYRPVGATTWQTSTSTSNSVNLTGLTSCTAYEVAVQANCLSSNTSSNTATTSVYVPLTNATPTGLTATPSASTGDIELNWSGTATGVTYIVEYREVGASTWQSATTTTTNYSLPELEGCSEYEVQVFAACDANGTGATPYSNIASFSTGKTIVKVKALLQGTYDVGGLMRNDLVQENLVDLAQPYNTSPWNYTGTESVTSLPTNAVDWVIVEIQDASNQYVTSTAAILLQDGSIVDYNGTVSDGVELCGLAANTPYYIVVRHRNHLDVMSANTVTLPNSTSYDFTTAVNQASTIGTTVNQLVDVGGFFALRAGDLDGDGFILVGDFNDVYQVESSIVNQYVKGDVNMDSNVTVADFNIYQPVVSISAVSAVRY